MPTEQQKMVTGQWYDPMDKSLAQLRKEARRKCEALNHTSVDDIPTRIKLLKQLFGRTGKRLYIEPTFKCDYGFNISVGESFFANFDCVMLDVAPITIGDNAMIGPQVGLYTAIHPLEAELRVTGIERAEPISIGHNCWIGGHATINPGVTLGDNVVVASGAVVTKSFGDNVVIGGSPAKVLKELS